MAGSSTARDSGEVREAPDRTTFLASHRALAACTREFGRLADEIGDRVAALRDDGVEIKPVVRLEPGRCIVQLGPVALTVSWLRSTLDSAADGRLLAIVWRGIVAPRMERLPEHVRSPEAMRPPTVLWEETLEIGAASEALWEWRPEHATDGYTSSALAAQCVERLHTAFAETN